MDWFEPNEKDWFMPVDTEAGGFGAELVKVEVVSERVDIEEV